MLCLLFALIEKQATIYFYFKMKNSLSRIYFSFSVLNLFYSISQNKLLETFTMKNFIDHTIFIVVKMKLNSQRNCHPVSIKFPIMKH